MFYLPSATFIFSVSFISLFVSFLLFHSSYFFFHFLFCIACLRNSSVRDYYASTALRLTTQYALTKQLCPPP